MLPNWLLQFLPPYNLARMFSYTRVYEDRVNLPCQLCALKDEMIADLRQQGQLRENYILSLLGQRPINVAERKSEGVTATAIAGRSTLKAVRQAAVAKAVASSLDVIDKDGMSSRADEYAKRVSEG